jgi:2-polyprenyl-3-methyl-5-hydroxy-6-metoxy-1,4-benzoquinol methylase
MTTSLTDRSPSMKSTEFTWTNEGQSEFHKWILPILGEFMARICPNTAVDIGCGNGYVASRLSEQGIEAIGVDSSQSGIELAQKSYPTIEFIHADIMHPIEALSGKRCDCVVALDVIEHLWMPRVLFRRSRELLKPGAHLILSTPYHGYWKNLALAVTNAFDKHWHPLRDHGHVKFFSAKTIRALCEEEGFSVVDFRRAGRIPPLAKSMILLLKDGRTA